MAIECVQFKAFEKGTLQGFCSLLLTNIGLEIRDCTLHEKNGSKWIGLPSKPYKDAEGNEKYSYIVKFPDKDRYHAFQKEALNAVNQRLNNDISTTPDDAIPF